MYLIPLFLFNVQDTLNVLKEQSEVDAGHNSSVEESQHARESSEEPTR